MKALPVVGALLILAGALAVACAQKNGASQGALDADDAGDAEDAPAEGSTEAGDAAEEAPQTQAFVRLAQLSPDLTSVDLCVAPHGTTTFQGPLIAQLAETIYGDAGAADAAPQGLAFPQVSAYLALDPGPYDVRIVSAGSTMCSDASGVPDASDAAAETALLDVTSLPALAVGTYTTWLLAGDWQPAGSDPGLTLAMLPDDSVLAGGGASLRGVDAIPSWPAADFGLVSATAQWLPLLTDVAFAAGSAHAGPDQGAIDGNGYLAVAPMSAQPMGARPSSADGGAPGATASAVNIVLGSVATMFAVGGKTGDTAHPPALLLCTDNQPSGGLLSDCSIAQ